MNSISYTDERLEALDREVGGLIAQMNSGGDSGGSDESKERIERILRRVRLEERIQEEADAAIQSQDAETPKEGKAPVE